MWLNQRSIRRVNARKMLGEFRLGVEKTMLTQFVESIQYTKWIRLNLNTALLMKSLIMEVLNNG